MNLKGSDATEDQIKHYTPDGDAYVRQYQEVIGRVRARQSRWQFEKTTKKKEQKTYKEK